MMPDYSGRTRILAPALLIGLLALPAAGLAAGQARFAADPVPTLGRDLPATTLLITRPIGRASAGGAINVQLRGKPDNIRARQVTTFKIDAVDADGVLLRNARLAVDFGDGTTKTFKFDRRLTIEHVWVDRGSYKMTFRVTAKDGTEARGKLRVRVNAPLRVFFQVLGEETAKPDEASDYRFVAVAREARKVRGTLSVDWGDGNVETVENFDGDEQLSHTYANEATHTIKATLTYDDGRREKAATLRIEVKASGGAIDLRTAIIAANSAQDIAAFRVSSTVTGVSITPGLMCIFHTRAGSWPTRNGLEGNPWIAAFLSDGKLYAGTYEWLRSGQVCKNLGAGKEYRDTAHALGPHIKHGPMAQWVPKKGETVYLFVSTVARLGVRASDERTDPWETTWPY